MRSVGISVQHSGRVSSEVPGEQAFETRRRTVLDAIAAVGFGAHTWAGGKLGVTWAADDQPIEGVVNMATMRAKSFRVQYQTVETADSIEFQYFDRDRDYAWKTLRVMDPVATTSLNPARVTAVGITSEAHAAVRRAFTIVPQSIRTPPVTLTRSLAKTSEMSRNSPCRSAASTETSTG